MTVVGIDDTDARDRGMCTTYVGARVAAQLGSVERLVLVRLNPAVPHKTRGNAAVAIHTNESVAKAMEVTTTLVSALAETDVEGTNPGVVAVPEDSKAVPDFTKRAIREQLTIEEATDCLERIDARTWGAGSGRGRIGALAAVGAWSALEDWTYETIAYREPAQWGTPRSVDDTSVRDEADAAYPAIWDTIDRETGETVCVPHTPCPVLYGIRGDDRSAVRSAARAIDAEPVSEYVTFVTNQGTDGHLQPATIGSVQNGQAFKITADVAGEPRTEAGGHVFFSVGSDGDELQCVAFEPTKHFRKHIRALRAGDRVTVCGEVTDGTLKLEKLALLDRITQTQRNPRCPSCGASMDSAGRDQGYRCRPCGERREEQETVALERSLEPGWYEVPPRARRHIAKPLVRGGFDEPVHPAK
ncbi:MAG: tRNA(Ile)(2)-agmatinylcytidine synthase [Natrialbaceae archaeon]|nr:tRNA(Ile)(2)-agmatinylcytidine synthase [Natrialbaceae archaeon]